MREGEEQFLYPAVDDLVKRYERATATMSLDHKQTYATR